MSEIKKEYIRSLGAFREFVFSLRAAIYGFDIECESLEPEAKIAGFSLYRPATNSAIYVPFDHAVDRYEDGTALSGGSPYTPFSEEDKQEIAKLLSVLQVITYNGAFDLGRFLKRFGYCPMPIGDGQLAGKMLQLKSWEGLKALAITLGIATETHSIEDILGEGNYNFRLAKLDKKTLDYTCQDAILAVLVEQEVIKKHLKPEKYKKWQEVYQLELDVMKILGLSELIGIPLDLDKFKITAQAITRDYIDLGDEVCTILNRDDPELDFNIASTRRLSAALFNAPDHEAKELKKGQHQDLEFSGLGLKPATRSGKNGSFSTATPNLELIEDQHAVIEKILEWKTMNSIVTRDIPHVEEWCPDGTVYPRFVQIGEDGTSRIYTAAPNVISMSKKVRRAMPPRENRIFIHSDFQAAEFIIAALLSGESQILDALDAGLDPHINTYCTMTNTSYPEDVTSDEWQKNRETGKVLNYAVIFGTSGYSIAMRLKCSQGEAKEMLAKFWATHPILHEWTAMRRNYAKEHARTYTVIGRVRKLPGVFSNNWKVKQKTYRQAVNTACQGSCGDALKLAIRNLYKLSQDPNSIVGKLNLKILCPVFDAILLEIDDIQGSDRAMIETELREANEVVLEHEGRSTRMKCDMGWSTESWYAAMMDAKA